MRFVDLIESKKQGRALSPDQIRWAIEAYLDDTVPDYQMAALLMAIRWRGLDDSEAAVLTEAMVSSGDRYDLSDLGAPAVDKHSTGGVGDKISLPLAPLVAACGCMVPMVSGRGLGHTGGTLDKLESIPGMRTDLDAGQFRAQLESLGVAMGAQTPTLVPADRRLYALRDVTGTVDDTGLITASILSKKIAEGAQALVLDVKVGSGAFFSDLKSGRALADRLLAVAGQAGLTCSALLTAMDEPLGMTVGNAIEVEEAIAILRGQGPADVLELVVELGIEMLLLAAVVETRDEARQRLEQALGGGAALERFRQLVEAQGGDARCVDDPRRLPQAGRREDIRSGGNGFIEAIDARLLGEAAIALRAGRMTKEDGIDPAAGLRLHARRGQPVTTETPWLTLHYDDGADVERAHDLVTRALTVSDAPPSPRPLILERRE